MKNPSRIRTAILNQIELRGGDARLYSTLPTTRPSVARSMRLMNSGQIVSFIKWLGGNHEEITNVCGD